MHFTCALNCGLVVEGTEGPFAEVPGESQGTIKLEYLCQISGVDSCRGLWGDVIQACVGRTRTCFVMCSRLIDMQELSAPMKGESGSGVVTSQLGHKEAR